MSAGTLGEDEAVAVEWKDEALCEYATLFEPFIYKNDHFTKTGSGQT